MGAVKDPRKVLVYVHSLELGGSQINAVELAGATREHGFESLIVGPKELRPVGPSLVDVAADYGVPLVEVVREPTTMRSARQLSKIAASSGAGVVHVYNTWSFRPAYWGPCLLASRPLVMTVYEMDIDPIVYRAPPLVVGAGYLAEQSTRRRGPVSLISPPVHLGRDNSSEQDGRDFLRRQGIGGNQVNIVVVSRLDGGHRPVKSVGIEYAMRAIHAIRRPDVNLIIVGTGNETQHLSEVAAQVNTALGRRACVMVGPLSDPRPAYASADIVIGMGGSAARGLAFGKPLIVQGEFGDFRLFDPSVATELFHLSFWNEEHVADPVQQLVETLNPLLLQPALRSALGRYGRSFAESHFGLEAMAQRLVEVYETATLRYTPREWLHDQRLEARWALGWLARRVAPRSEVSRRHSFSYAVARHDALSADVAWTRADEARSAWIP